jgi:hypothetical protein
VKPGSAGNSVTERPKKRKETSARPRGKRVEPGNPTSKATPENGIQDNIA